MRATIAFIGKISPQAGPRLIAVGIAMCLFYAPIWFPLQRLMRDLVGLWLSAAGFNPRWCEYDGFPGLQLMDRRYHFTPECTYADLALLLCVLLWSRRLGMVQNLGRLTTSVTAVAIIDLVRAGLALTLNAHGVSWLWCHQTPDFMFYWPVLGLAALHAAKDDGLPLTRVRPAAMFSLVSRC